VQSQGRQIPVSIIGTPLGEDEHPDILLVIHDTSAERQRSLNSDLLSQIDPLTELANRRGFERAIEDTIASASKHSSLALIDLDEFKGINDTHGHAAGDALLREVAKRLKMAIRKDDIAARIGGDEFALVLPGCPKHRAIEISEQVRSLIQDIVIPWEESQLEISVSVGVAIFETGIDQESLMSAADDACYQAKRAGKNRVVVVQI
jgi:diguanylate cyclase (GGDEF)-like protein